MASSTNPVQYTSRNFNSVLSDINSDTELVNKPNWIKRLIAGILDVASVWINALANLMFLRTAYTRQTVADLCELIGYTLSAQQQSSGTCLFYVSSLSGTAIFPFTVQLADLVAKSQGNVNTSALQFEAQGSAVTFSLTQYTFTASGNNLTVSHNFLYSGWKIRVSVISPGVLPTGLLSTLDYYIIYVNSTTIQLANSLANALSGVCITLSSAGSGTLEITMYSQAVTLYQQKSLSSAVTIGNSDGVTEWQEFVLPDQFVLKATLAITINSLVWTLKDDFSASGSTDTHYILIPLSNNQFSVRFGNGVYGAIPGQYSITAIYATGGGANSNVSSINRITVYAGSNTNITGVINATVFTGGADQETIANAKRVAPLLLKARDRFVTIEDGIALMLNYGGVAQAQVIANAYGILSCQAMGIATGGGQLSSALKTALQTYLTNRTILQSITVQVTDATITQISIDINVHLLTGYVWANVEDYVNLAMLMFLSEAGQQILSNYQSLGIASTVILINLIFSTSFGVNDYNQISILLNNYIPQTFGNTIQQSQFEGFLQFSIDGISYIIINGFAKGTSKPVVNNLPIVLTSDEISTPTGCSITSNNV